MFSCLQLQLPSSLAHITSKYIIVSFHPLSSNTYQDVQAICKLPSTHSLPSPDTHSQDQREALTSLLWVNLSQPKLSSHSRVSAVLCHERISKGTMSSEIQLTRAVSVELMSYLENIVHSDSTILQEWLLRNNLTLVFRYTLL